MRFLMHLTAAALLVAIGIGGMTAANAADRDARAAVIGRQKIREELSAALAKGHLTRMDQYRILLHAKEVLTADDLHGLEQTLNRIATQQATARAAATVVRSGASVQKSEADSEAEPITPSKYEESMAGEPVIGEPMPTRAKAPGQGPFIEEIPSPGGEPAMEVNGDDPEGCECDPDECRPWLRWINVNAFTSVDAFKGPMDIDNANGNFGMRLGANAAVPVLPRLGVALQAGASIVYSDLKGTNYPLSATNPVPATSRDQVFTTVGMFQRIDRGENGAYTWGFAYDWLFDNYYSSLNFGQWRVKAAYELDPCNEFGIQASLPEHGSTGYIYDSLANGGNGGYDAFSFKPIAQGFLYWKHTWCNDASLTGRFGVAERPGLFVFGAEGRVPLTRQVALRGDFTYIMPNSPGGLNDSNEGSAQAQEIWNVSVGIEFMLGGFGRCSATRLQPFLPVADNGSLAIHQSNPFNVF